MLSVQVLIEDARLGLLRSVMSKTFMTGENRHKMQRHRPAIEDVHERYSIDGALLQTQLKKHIEIMYS